jgi:poly(A) polymerase
LATKSTNSIIPSRYTADELGLKKNLVSRHAITVVKSLKKQGYEGYLVGGCVRDLLLGLEPKDFDVATSASPEEVRRAFRNARIIGRRFKLAHIRFGREIIEVATYRGAPAHKRHSDRTHRISNEGRLLADNIYGSRDEDALRRDLSVNSLYYDPLAGEVLDYHGGLEDIRKGQLRVIGDPEQRFREDPVRMLRVVRFAAKLGFEINDSISPQIHELCSLLADVPPARLFDEVLKLFHSGKALSTFEKLRHYGLFRYLFPECDECLGSEQDAFPRTFLPLALENTDTRIQQDKPVAPAFLFAALLWEPFRMHKEEVMAEGNNEHDSTHIAADITIANELGSVAIPKRFTSQVREIWAMQYFFDRRRKRQVYRLLENRKFRAGYDFLLLRAEVGQASKDIADWWTRIQDVDDDERRKMINSLSGKAGRRRRRTRKKQPS